jgi:hypothetical protein
VRKVENIVLRSSTGRTALSFSDAFFEVSYNPSRAAETKASISHMINFDFRAQR